MAHQSPPAKENKRENQMIMLTKHLAKPLQLTVFAIWLVCAWLLILASLAQADQVATPAPLIRAITATASIPISDTAVGLARDKVIYFNPAQAGLLTLQVEVTGSPPLTLTSGFAFNTNPAPQTANSSPAQLSLLYPVSAGSTTWPHVIYRLTDNTQVSTTVVITYLHDITAPTVHLSPPFPGPVITTSTPSQVTLTGSFTEVGAGLSQLDVSAGFTWTKVTAMTPTLSSQGLHAGDWAYNWNLPTVDQRTYTLTVRGIDYVDNQISSNPLTVVIDRVSPLTSPPQPQASPWIMVPTIPYTWPIPADKAGIATYRLHITNTTGYSQYMTTPQANYTFNQANEEGVIYRARVQAMDINGNSGPWSEASQGVMLDQTEPAADVTAPISTFSGQVIPLTWSASDVGSGPATITLEITFPDNTTQTSERTGIPLTSQFSASPVIISGTINFSDTAQAGDYHFSLGAIDHAGNTSATVQKIVSVSAARVYIPLMLRNYPPSSPLWNKASGLPNDRLRMPFPCNTSTWYVGSSEDGIWQSTNNAQTWGQVVQFNAIAFPVLPNPANCQQIFAAVWGDGVHRITAGSDQIINTNLPEKFIYGLAITNNILLAGSNTYGMYTTTLGTINWQAANTGLTDLRIRSLNVQGGSIFAGARECIFYYSVDLAVSWEEEIISPIDNGCDDAQVWQVLRVGQVLYAGLGADKGAYYKQDTAWLRVPGVPVGSVYGLTYDDVRHNLYVSVYGAGVYRCTVQPDTGLVSDRCEAYNVNLTALTTREITYNQDMLVLGSDTGLWYINLP